MPRQRSPARAISKIEHLPWVPYHVSDWARDTAGLSALEQGAYHLLVDHYYLTGCWPPDDDAQLWRLAHCDGLSQWLEIRPRIVRFFRLRQGFWQHNRAERIARLALRTYQINVENGRRGGLEKARRAKELSSEAGSEASTNQNQNHKEKKDITTEDSVERGARTSKRARRAPADQPQLFPQQERPDGRGSRLASNWQPSQAERDFARDLGLDPQVVAEHFGDYWHSRAGAGGTKRDWTATWRIWCRREAERAGAGPSTPRSGLARPAARGGLVSAIGRVHARLVSEGRDRK